MRKSYMINIFGNKEAIVDIEHKFVSALVGAIGTDRPSSHFFDGALSEMDFYIGGIKGGYRITNSRFKFSAHVYEFNTSISAQKIFDTLSSYYNLETFTVEQLI